MEKVKLTEQGLLDLQNELERLKTVDRKANLEALKEARAQGDLSENADYDAARDEQASIEARIKEIESILKNYELIDSSKADKKIVNIGNSVTIQINDLEPNEYKLVGTIEADPLNNKISNESPIGKAIIGCKKGDEIVVKGETGRDIRVKVIDFS
ncbi:MAG: transcription elongation factor GreA [Candidatus Izemoplasma sp.]|nr:transcription elongation factor GreA [Candidatus Izemoplasma sp.]